jgi:hypothetical protein
MTAIVVLGCHRSGTTLVTRLLHEMGVYMGARMDRRNWEDADFQKTNQTILDMADGNWGKPPAPEAITEAVAKMAVPYFLSMKRQSELWGWKDPRTVLTIHALHPYLEDPRYVVIRRNKRDVVSSLTLRSGWKWNWGALVDEYVKRLDAFVAETDAPVLEMDYEQLTNQGQSKKAVRRLAQFVGKEAGDAEWGIVQFVPKVNWKTTRGAVLSDDERQWLFDRSAELHEEKRNPLILHIGVEYGGSLHCCRAGAPDARLVGVDLDTSKFLGRAGVEFMTGDSAELAYDFHDKIDLLFIDGDHSYEGVRADMVTWLGKVRPGGIVAFHDYELSQDTLKQVPWAIGVKEAVDEWHWADTTWEEIEGVDSIKAYRRKPLLKAGDEFGTIGIGVPYYKAVYGFFQWFTWVLVGGLRTGDTYLNTDNVRCEVPIPMAHNSLVREFLRTDRDTFCMVEDDHVGPQDIIEQMRTKAENQQCDIVCASYPTRHGNIVAVGYNFDGSVSEYGEYGCRIEPMEVTKTGTQLYDGACLGLVLIRRWVLEALQKAYDPETEFWFDWNGRNSQDVVFYARTYNELGIRVGVDRDNELGHIGKHLYTMDEYWNLMDKHKEKEQQEA